MTRSQAVAESLRQEIRSGAIPGGSRLRQVEVAARLGVSTTPVREVFLALQREGLLIADSHKAVMVFKPTIADLTENYAIRIELECLATRIAVPRLTDEDFEELVEILEQMSRAKPAKYIQLNRQVHRAIYRRAEMPRLMEIIEDLGDAALAYQNLIAYEAPEGNRGDVGAAQAAHEAIVAACRRTDADAAVELMAEHLRHTAQLVEKQLSTASADEGDVGAGGAAIAADRLRPS